jgi:transcriptional regulator with XRE-family HTH domain
MKVSHTKLKRLCQDRGLTLHQLLQEAGVSKNAYYSLVRKEALLPRSLLAIADRLDVRPSAFLEEVDSELERTRRVLEEVDRIARRHKGVDRDNVRHSLLLLEEKPIERLRGALRRGQNIHVVRPGTQVP